jgi:hypothetical protein
MQSEENTHGQGRLDKPSWDSILRAEEELLNRARKVSQQINERVRKVLGTEYPEPPPDQNQQSQSA